ncbi:MAG: hypothetical protein HN884_06160 [Rhodospirillaceae bacterium]|nr:hypothetical protein [Rhodospirillaceae bacterium]
MLALLIFCLPIFLIGVIPSPAAGATCPPMPPVPWWKKSHVSVEKYVRRKYKGNWQAYEKKWVRARTKLADLYVRKKTVYLKSQDLSLKGDELRDYVDHVDARIRVIQCLKKKNNLPEKEEFAEDEGSTYTCKPIPEVSWWGDLNHDNIKFLVKRNYKGNWQRYIKFWEEEMQALMASFGLGQEAVVNKLGFSLSNEELGLYVSKVSGMIAVLHCLADDAKKK